MTNKHETPSERTYTYLDYPDFYQNAAIQRIANTEKWTISDKKKRPMDMHAWLNEGLLYGASTKRGYNPYIDLQTLINNIPDCTNNAYYLEADQDKLVVLDIEPKCPAALKKALLQLPWLYGETSMSGKGYHLLFDLPQDLWTAYPAIQNKLAIKEEHGYYEILLNHMVTFTRNTVEHPAEEKDISEFYNLFEKLANETRASKTTNTSITVKDIDTSNIPLFDRTINVLSAQTYRKKPEDFYDDMSKYEFGMASFYDYKFCCLIQNDLYKDITYTTEQRAIFLYTLLKEHLTYRNKHDEQRSGMPWLLYVATRAIALHDDEPDK